MPVRVLHLRCTASVPQDIVQDKVGWWLGVYFMALSAGRFVGPLVIGAVTRMATPDGEHDIAAAALS